MCFQVFIGAFFADMPGRFKAMMRGGVGSWIGCSYCLMQSREGEGKRKGAPASLPACLPACLVTCHAVAARTRLRCACLTDGRRAGKYYFGYCKGENYNEGYDDGVKQTVLQAAQRLPLEDAPTAYCGDKDLKLASADMLYLADAVEKKRMSPTVAGTTGLSPFVRWLPHISYVDFFPLPVAHALLLGVVKDFWEYVGTLQVCGPSRPAVGVRAHLYKC